MKEKLYHVLIELTNGGWTSSMIKKFATSHFSRKWIPSYVKHYQINLDEVKKPTEEFYSLHEFFIRDLKEDVHLIAAGEESVISPVDAVIEDFGVIHESNPIVVKGRNYVIEEMLGNQLLAKKYLGGTYIVFYLSPRDYHQIHAPIDGSITHTSLLGNKSFPVNKMGMKYGKDPLSKNYRQITEIKHGESYVTMVKVGAMVINTIVRTHLNEHLTKGERMAYFSFGSTVVLLFEKDKFLMEQQIQAPYPIRMGTKIGELK